MVVQVQPAFISATSETDCPGALRSFVSFAIALLLLDTCAKFLLFGYFDSLSHALGADWQVSCAVQLAGLLGLAILNVRLLRSGPRDLAGALVFVAVVVVASFACTAFQDFSYDGGWYHFSRVSMFPVGGALGNVTATVHGDPSVFYPLLPDNLRGLAIIALGTGPFSGVSINIACAGAGIWFWDRFATFLPRWMRWIAASSPVAAAQMMTYYGDGCVASIGAMGLLVAILLVLEWTGANPRTGARAVMLFLIALTLLLAQMKLSFPALVAEFTLPLWIALAVGGVAVWRGRSSVLASAVRRLGAELGEPKCMAAIALCCAAGLLALANPYFLYLKSATTAVPYPWFAPATILHWSDLAFNVQFLDLFGEMPAPLWFPYANMTAIWPGGAHALVEPQIHGAGDLVRSLIVRIATCDARFSGYGPFSALVLVYALWRSLADLRKGMTELTLPTLLAATFLIELALAMVVPLAWWARMNPAIYAVATVMVLVRLDTAIRRWSASGYAAKGRAMFIVAPLLCTVIVVPALVLPPLVNISRTAYKMQTVRLLTRSLADQVAARPDRSLMLPNRCPAPINNEQQASFAAKFLAAFPDRGIKASFRGDDQCVRRAIDINPGLSLCYCAPR